MSNAWLDAQARRDEWPHGFYRAGKDMDSSDDWYPHHRIVVTAGLSAHGWSVTCDIIDRRNRRDEGGGAVHDLIARYFPDLAPVIALHLSDDEGVPMHAVANARYWLGLTEYKTGQVRPDEHGGLVDVELPHVPTVMSHLRITEDEANQLIADSAEYADNPAKLGEDIMLRWSARWASESAEARKVIDRLRAAGT